MIRRGPFEQRHLMRRVALWNLNRVAPGEASIAKTLALLALERVEPVPTQIAERIGGDPAANFFNRVVGGEQFLLSGRVDSIKARASGRRRRDAHMNLARACLPQ